MADDKESRDVRMTTPPSGRLNIGSPSPSGATPSSPTAPSAPAPPPARISSSDRVSVGADEQGSTSSPIDLPPERLPLGESLQAEFIRALRPVEETLKDPLGEVARKERRTL